MEEFTQHLWTCVGFLGKVKQNDWDNFGNPDSIHLTKVWRLVLTHWSNLEKARIIKQRYSFNFILRSYVSPKHHDHSRSFKAENKKFDDRNITTRFSSHIVCVDLIHSDRSGESDSHCQFGRRDFSPQRLEKLRDSYLGRLKKKNLGMSLKHDTRITNCNVVTDHDNTYTRVESCR